MLFCLTLPPHLFSTNGIGIMTVATQANSVPAHCTPRFANNCLENNGKPAATVDRSMMFAATVDAAL